MSAIRNSIFGLAIVAVAAPVIFASDAEAVVLYTDRASWEAAIAPAAITETSAFPAIADFTVLDTIVTDGGTTLSFTADVEKRSVPDSWSTWSGGNEPDVFYSMGATSVTASITDVSGFGLEMEPNPFAEYLMRLTLSDGSAVEQLVHGFAGAKFFGWIGAGVVELTMSAPVDFAFGRFVEAGTVPEPATALLFGCALLGLAGLRRRMAATA